MAKAKSESRAFIFHSVLWYVLSCEWHRQTCCEHAEGGGGVSESDKHEGARPRAGADRERECKQIATKCYDKSAREWCGKGTVALPENVRLCAEADGINSTGRQVYVVWITRRRPQDHLEVTSGGVQNCKKQGGASKERELDVHFEATCVLG